MTNFNFSGWNFSQENIPVGISVGKAAGFLKDISLKRR
jgi:hypothetical protein